MAIKVLLVDDEINFQRVINQVLKQQIKSGKYEFNFATNGQEALDKIVSGLKVDVALVDIRMPEMDGLTLIEELNNLGNLSVNSIIVSAYADMPNVRKAMKERAFDFLAKPIGIDELEEAIGKAYVFKKQSRQLAKPTEGKQTARVKSLIADPSSKKVTLDVACRIAKQLPVGQRVELLRRLMEGLSLDALIDLKYELETQEYIEIENQEKRNKLAVEVYQDLGFDEAKIPLIALEKGFIEERVIKRNMASGDVKDYGIHLYLRWREEIGGVCKGYYLGPLYSLDERTKILVSLLGYSLDKETLAPTSPTNDEAEPLTYGGTDVKRIPKPPIKMYGKDVN